MSNGQRAVRPSGSASTDSHLSRAAGGHTWSSYYREITAGDIALAHELGLLVKVWTVNDVAHMESLIAMGVYGIITDYPDRLRKVLEKNGSPLPDPTPVGNPGPEHKCSLC